MSAEDPRQPEAVWAVHARPVNASHEPWRVMRIEARSAIQAEAILRRRGYETAAEWAIRCAGPGVRGEVIPPAELQPLACASCGYHLSGLVIERASVRCPECSFQQPLVAWNDNGPTGAVRIHPLVIALAVIGGLSVGFVVLLVMLIIASF